MATPGFDVPGRIGDYLKYPRRVLLEALESAFSSPHLFTAEDESPNPFLYIKDPEKGDTSPDSLIEIADGWTNELDKTNPRPIILCQRDALRFAEGTLQGLKNFTVPYGDKRQYSDVIQVPLNFLCFSRIDTESDELALATGFFLRLFREHIRNRSKILKIGSPTIGPPTPIRTDARVDLFSSPVSLTTEYTIVWTVTWQDLKTASDFEIEVDLKAQPAKQLGE